MSIWYEELLSVSTNLLAIWNIICIYVYIHELIYSKLCFEDLITTMSLELSFSLLCAHICIHAKMGMRWVYPTLMSMENDDNDDVWPKFSNDIVKVL